MTIAPQALAVLVAVAIAPCLLAQPIESAFIADRTENFDALPQTAPDTLFDGELTVDDGAPAVGLASSVTNAQGNAIVASSGDQGLIFSGTVAFDLTDFPEPINGLSFAAASESGALGALLVLDISTNTFQRVEGIAIGNADGTMTTVSYVFAEDSQYIILESDPAVQTVLDDLAYTTTFQLQGPCEVATPLLQPVAVPAVSDQWAAPPGYYAGATGTGSALKSQLTAAMSAGHIQRAYGDFRNSARLHDADPDVPGSILLGYSRESVSGNWDQGDTWNREHVWPVSRQPGSSSNSRRGNLGDPHALRPLKPSTNTSRSNKPFGFENTTGNFGSQGSYYFPGDIDKGDVARSLFYSATRYASSGLTLTDSFPSGNQMGDLTALVAWHYLDTPDEFERRRNHVIYSQALNPSYFTRNRSAFVDVPGAVWSVFVDDLNDSQLWVGSTPNPDGGSCVDASVRALATAPAMSFEVPLNRWGNDGTYYAVISTGDAVSDQPLHNGFTGAFAINEAASRTIRVGIDPSVVAGPGSYSGTVTVDNLDRTTGFGNGFGALDADDVIEVNLEALAASSASFDASTAQLATTIDLGSLGSGQTVQQMVPVYALSSVPGFTAGSDITLNGVAGTGGTLMVTPPAGVLEAGMSDSVLLSFTAGASGAASFTVVLDAADDPDLIGAVARDSLTITVNAEVRFNCDLTADVNNDGIVDASDFNAWILAFNNKAPACDQNADGLCTPADFNAWVLNFNAGCP